MALFHFNKADNNMNMIGHNNIAVYIMSIALQKIKPFVHHIICFSCLYKWQPFIIGEGYKERSISIRYGCFKIHQVKLCFELLRNVPYGRGCCKEDNCNSKKWQKIFYH